MRLAILGCGYVGMAVAWYWHNLNRFVITTTRKPERVADLKTISSKVYLLSPHPDFSALVNQADTILVAVAPKHGDTYHSTYIETTQKLNAALLHAPAKRRVVYISSTSVYGECEGAKIEETFVNPVATEHMQLLLASEAAVQQAAQWGHEILTLRLGEIIGPGREIAARIKRHMPKPFPGNGRNWTNIIHIEDIVQAIEFLQARHATGIYHLVNDLKISRKTLYEILCKKLDLPEPTWDASLSSPHLGNKYISNAKLLDLGYTFIKPKAPLDERDHACLLPMPE